MNNQSKYLKNTLRNNISAVTLGFILLVSPSIGFAKKASVSEPIEKQALQNKTVINLNKSTFEQLVSLKGIGHTKAQAIIVYRQQVGGFKSVDELIKVRGIGEKIVEENRKRLSL